MTHYYNLSRYNGNVYGTIINDWFMPLTRDFKETIRARAARDPKFRKELLREGIECMLAGDTATAEATHIPSKSLMRMLGPTGNPRADNLFEIVSFLQHREGVRFHVKAELA